MKNFILGLTCGLLFFVISAMQVKRKEIIVEVPTVIYVTDTVPSTITKIVRQLNNPFYSFNDVINYTSYIKTESSLLNDDNWAVNKVMMNRLNRANKSWRQFVGSPNDHCSPTILNMSNGKRYNSINLESTQDLQLIIRSLCAALRIYPDNIEKSIPDNTYYFESHPDSWNQVDKPPFIRDSITAKFIHEFYKG